MTERQEEVNGAQPAMPEAGLKKRTLVFYGQILDIIVTALVVIVLLTLVGALFGLVLDFVAAIGSFRAGMADPSFTLSKGLLNGFDKELVIDVLSVFLLIELFRTFTDYLEYHRVRLRVLTEVGIAFILREIFIGLYDHSLDWSSILALSVLLGVLVAARVAAIVFQPREDTKPDAEA